MCYFAENALQTLKTYYTYGIIDIPMKRREQNEDLHEGKICAQNAGGYLGS